jgi:hypothetical protein
MNHRGIEPALSPASSPDSKDNSDMKKSRLTLVALLLLACCGMLLGVASRAEDFDNMKPGAPKWKVVDYNRVQAHPARVPDKVTYLGDGGISFKFLNTPDTALLATSHPSYNGTLLGDLTGKTVSAKVGVSVSPTTVFTYYGEPDGCGRSANVRLYFQTDTGGKFEETDYWWSNPVSVDLEALKSGDQTLTVPLTPDMWSDFYGHYGTDFPVQFNAAVADVQLIGTSFGGGCFFENGVGVSSGGGVFRLMDFNVQ